VSYEIHPETPAEGISLEELFGPRHRAMQELQAERCRDLGLPFRAHELLSNSRLAIEAAEYARDSGHHPAFHRAILTAYFARSADIGDSEVLGDIGTEVGLDRGELSESLSTGRYAGRGAMARQEAARLGITAVPTFIFPDATRVVGAQPVEEFRKILDRLALEERG
jgi:predicted DsbA family dithiol-disulfide isomerase